MMSRKFSVLILFLFLTACTQASRYPSTPTYRGEVPRSQISEAYQARIPVNGGQKIPIPTQKTEVGILWAAPSGRIKHNYSNLLNSNYVSGNLLGQISQLEALLASQYLDQLLYKNTALTRKVAKRAVYYLPYIIRELEKRALPVELAALPMVESAYISNAVSHAGAAGLWQIMPLTGKDLGLNVSSHNDERFNFQKSTRAALDYLEILYEKFNDWPLAISAYNCGEGRLARALNISKTDNLVDLLDYCEAVPAHLSPLQTETQRYFPKFIAAIISLKKIGVLPNATSIALDETIKINGIMTRTKPPEAPLQLQGDYSKLSTTILQPIQNNSQQKFFFQPVLRMTRAQ